MSHRYKDPIKAGLKPTLPSASLRVGLLFRELKDEELQHAIITQLGTVLCGEKQSQTFLHELSAAAPDQALFGFAVNLRTSEAAGYELTAQATHYRM
eukprot:1914569-Amphidinium_carterae.1